MDINVESIDKQVHVQDADSAADEDTGEEETCRYSDAIGGNCEAVPAAEIDQDIANGN